MTMWAKVERWQLRQLERLAYSDPDRGETVMNTLWRSFPGLYSELAISAVDQEMLSIEDCGELLTIPEAEVEERLMAFRGRKAQFDQAVVLAPGSRVAKLADGRVAVWEVIREYRRLGSVESLRGAFPSITESDLVTAIRYAEANPAEIEALINEYEEVLAKRRAEYPFAQ